MFDAMFKVMFPNGAPMNHLGSFLLIQLFILGPAYFIVTRCDEWQCKEPGHRYMLVGFVSVPILFVEAISFALFNNCLVVTTN